VDFDMRGSLLKWSIYSAGKFATAELKRVLFSSLLYLHDAS